MALTQISTKGIKDSTIATVDLADDAVTQAKLAEDAVGASHLDTIAAGSNGQFLKKDDTGAGGITWAAANQYTHPNHTGEVTSTADGAQVIATNVVDEDNLKISNAGTNGQYLQKQSGNTGGLTWADVTIPPAGNTLTAVANGAIANNKAVKIDTDGKVSQIGESVTNLSTLGHTTGSSLSGTGDHYWIGSHALYHEANEQIVFIWQQGSSSIGRNSNSTIYAQAATVNSSGTYTFGNAITVYNSSSMRHVKALYDPDTEKIIVVAQLNNYDLRSQILSVASDKTITKVGSDSQIDSHTGTGNPKFSAEGFAYDPDNNKYVLIYLRDTQSGYADKTLWSVVGNYNTSNDTISWGTPVVLDSSNMGNVQSYGDSTDMCYDETANCMVVITQMYHHASDKRTSTMEGVVSSSSNTITWQNYNLVDAEDGNGVRVTYDSAAGKNIIGWLRNADGTNGKTFRVATMTPSGSSGTAPTIGGVNTLETSSTYYHVREFAITYDSGLQKCVVVYPHWPGSGDWINKAAILTISGTSISASHTGNLSGATQVISSQEHQLWTAAYHPVARRICYTTRYKVSGTAYLKSHTVATQSVTSNLTDANHYVGFADQAYTNGQTATIKTYGNTVDTLSGLTAGTIYYLKGDGTVATSSGFPSFATNSPLAGTALSASKLLIRDPLAKT